MRQRLKLLKTLFDVHRWSRSWDTGHCLKELKNESVPCISPIVLSSRQPFIAHNNEKNWTKWFFNDFRKWSVSRLLDYLWTSNKVCFEASTCWLNQYEKVVLNLSWKCFKNTMFWVYIFLLQSVYYYIIYSSLKMLESSLAKFENLWYSNTLTCFLSMMLL